MIEANQKPQPKRVLMLGPVPVVPLIIALIWVLMSIIYYTTGLPHNVSLPIVLATIAWFIVWLVRAARA